MDRLEAKVLQGTLDLLDRKAHLEILDLQVAQDRLDSRDNQVPSVKVEFQVQVELPAPWEQLASKDHLDRLAHREVQEVWGNLASKDLQGQPELQVHLVSRGPLDRLDHRALPAKGVSQVMPDLQEILAPLDQLALLGPMVYQVHLDRLVREVQLAPAEVREVLDRLVHLDHRAPEDPMVNRASRDRLVLWALLDTLDNKD